MGNTEIESLRGYEFMAFSPDIGGPMRCYVAHADREVGITIKDAETDEDAFCVSRSQFLEDAKNAKRRDGLRLYHELFSGVLRGIQDGSGQVSFLVDVGNGIIRLATKQDFAHKCSAFDCAF